MKKLLLVIAVAILALAAGCGKGNDGAGAGASDTLRLLVSAIDSATWPIAIGADGEINAMTLDEADTTLTVRLTVADDYVDSAVTASDASRQDFLYRLMLLNGAAKRILTLSRGVPVNLIIDVSTPMRPDVVTFGIAADRLRSMSTDAPSERECDEVKVYNRVISDNAYCPYELEDGVTMLAMTVQDRYVTFHTEIDVEKLDFLVMKQNRDSVNAAVVEALHYQLADSVTRSSLMEISKARLGYRNRYISSDRADSFDISFTPSDLERLITLTDSTAAVSRR